MSNRRLFAGLASKGTQFAEPAPFWKVLSLQGWCVLLLAISSTVSLVASLLVGVSFLALITRFTTIHAISATLPESPLLFFMLLALNALIAVVCWWLFISWLVERRYRESN